MQTVIVTDIPVIGVIITTQIQEKYANKKDTIETKLTNIQITLESEIKSLKDELLNHIAQSKKEADAEILSRCKVNLVSLMSRIDNGYTPTSEEKMMLGEVKDLYNSKGGDSYVDDFYDKLLKEGKL